MQPKRAANAVRLLALCVVAFLALVVPGAVLADGSTAAFTVAPAQPAASEPVQFTDASTGAASWSWSFGDGAASSSQSPSHTYAAGGTYPVTLTVTDSGGGTSTVSHTVQVSAPTSSAFVAAPRAPRTGQTVNFADVSEAAAGRTIASWEWSFGDGATSTLQSPQHAYAAAGAYAVGLTVTDNLGKTSHSVQSLAVLDDVAAHDVSVSTAQGTSVAVDITVPDSGVVYYLVTEQPSHGMLTGTAPHLTYDPDPGFSGADSFTYVASRQPIGGDPYAAAVTADDPVAWWRLNETAGTAAHDSSGNGHDGSLVGSPTQGAAGAPPTGGDTAVRFAGEQRLDVPYSAALNPATYTLEAWVRPDELPGSGSLGLEDSESILCSRTPAATEGYHLFISSYTGHAQFAVIAGTGSDLRYTYDDTSRRLEIGRWYHVVATMDGTYVHLFVDGRPAPGPQNGTGSLFPPNTVDPSHVGMCESPDGSLDYGFLGSIDEAAIYDHVLTPTDVAAHFDAASPQLPAGRVSITVGKRPAAIAYTGPGAVLADGTLTARLTDPGDPSTAQLAGHQLQFVVAGQTYTGTTDANGNASVALQLPVSALGPQSVQISLVDDAVYDAPAVTASVVVAALPAGGIFAVGDRHPATSVTFWSADWGSDNPLSGSTVPSSFKGGFVNQPGLPACGSQWHTNPGASSEPPATVPSYMPVVVTSMLAKDGSAISGNVVGVLVVRTNTGYAPSPGHAGTGAIVATVC